MDKFKLMLFSVVSGIIMSLSWPAIGDMSFLIYLGFVPLLLVEHQISKSVGKTGFKVFCHAYLGFFVFNLITTYWIHHASLWGACMAIICNALFMACVFWLFHITKKRVGNKEGYIAFVIYWIGFEYLHINWELSWTWLTLGNAFASSINMVQWYEYTGVLGGSLLVLLVNLFIFKGVIQSIEKNVFISKYYVGSVLLTVGMYLFSSLGFQSVAGGEEIEAVIVQPNIDPYNEKFGGMAPSDQIDKMMDLAKQQLSAETDLLVFPETAIPEAHWEHEVNYLYTTDEIRKLDTVSPNLKTIIGSSASVLYTDGMELSPTANAFSDGSGFYDNYNAALFIDQSQEIQIHHKSKLVLGVEKLPFIRSIPLMKKLSINLGGTSGGLGTQESPSVFQSKGEKMQLAPIICYESIYGNYVTEYTRKGANLFAIITNDGWWDDTPGYKQHLAYASLRAIENRRSIVRSANTGVSAIINQRGEIFDQTNWWEPAVIKGKVTLNDELTFYARYGDFIGRIAALLAVLMILLTVVRSLNKTERRLKL